MNIIEKIVTITLKLTAPVMFATFHCSYGISYRKGILDFIVFKKHRRNRIVDVPLTR